MNNIKKIVTNNWFQFIAFSGIIWLVFVHLHINRHLEDLIIGPHFWRKSDTYAQIMNYYFNDLNFFDHGIHYNQLDSKGKVLGEFPLMYWLIALQLKVFGNSILLIKFNLIILLNIGLFSIFKISEYYLKNIFLALVVSLVLFLSPVFTFYSIDYLPDPFALNIMFFGLWFLLKHELNSSRFNLIFAISLIAFSGMIKPFFLIPFIAYVCMLLFKKMFFKQKLNSKFWVYFSPFIIVLGWFLYSNWYNSTIGSDYFLSSTRSIWSFKLEKVNNILVKVTEEWAEHYFHENLYYLLFGLMLINLLWWKKQWVNLNIYYLFCVLGVLAFISLFYGMFDQHDYYIYPILFLLPLTIGLTGLKINSILSNGLIQSSFGLILLVLLFFGINNSWKKNEYYRKAGWINNRYIFDKYENLSSFLLKSNVLENDLVITVSDMSPSFALSLINRKGWSGYQIKRSMTIKQMISWDAKYIIINDLKKLSPQDSIKVSVYLDYPVADTNHIFIYNIEPYKLNN